MADGIPVTPGEGMTVASEEIDDVQWQAVKIGIGAHGSATPWEGEVEVTELPGVEGPAARDAAVSGKPLLNGGRAVALGGTTHPTAVNADDDSVDWLHDREGVPFVHPHGFHIKSGLHAESAEAHTNVELVAAIAGLAFHVTDILFSTDTDATTMKLVEDTSGTPVALTPIMQFKAGGGCALHFVTPIRNTVGKNVGFTTVTNHTGGILISGYYAP